MHRAPHPLLVRLLAASAIALPPACSRPSGDAARAETDPGPPRSADVAAEVVPSGTAPAPSLVPQGTSASPPASSAPALPSASAAASASAPPLASSAPALPRLAIPPEPRCSAGPCASLTHCSKALASEPARSLPPPFERCPPYVGRGTFSRAKTEQQRRATADVCCYVQLDYPPRGRALVVGGAPQLAVLRGRGDWSS